METNFQEMEFGNALIEASAEPVAISRPEKEKQAN